MSYVTTGLTAGGLTTHFQVQYDSTLPDPYGKDRANALIPVLDSDFTLIQSWFGGINLLAGFSNPIVFQIGASRSGGADWFPPPASPTVLQIFPGDDAPAAWCRMLMVAELVEMFELSMPGAPWWGGAPNEGQQGEALSQFVAVQFLIYRGLASGSIQNYGEGRYWLGSPRVDYVNSNDPTDGGRDAKVGCSVLFLNYLRYQLRFPVQQIIAATPSVCLADTYRKLTGLTGDPFPEFKALLDAQYPGVTAPATDAEADNPWPIVVQRRPFGGGSADVVTDSNGNRIPNATVTMFTAEFGGAQADDLLDHNGARMAVLTADSRGQLLGFHGPKDGTSELWADAGGPARIRMQSTDIADRITTLEVEGAAIAVHSPGPDVVFSRTVDGDPFPWFVLTGDRRMFLLDGQTSLATVRASTADWHDAKVVMQGNPAVGGVGSNVLALRGGNPDGTNIHPLFSVTDGPNNAPIEQTLNAGGKRVNDWSQTMLSVYGPFWNGEDIYGYKWQRGRMSFVHDGPPGNALAYATACGEVFDGSRTPSIGNWQSAFGATGFTAVANPTGGITDPSESFHVIACSAGFGTNMIVISSTTPGVMIPAAPGNYVKGLMSFRAATAARTITPSLQWLDASGASINADTAGTAAADSTSAWTKYSVGGVAPTGTVAVALKATAPSIAAGEIHYLAGAGLWVDSRTSSAADPNPENVWSPPLTGQDNGTGARTSMRTGDKYERTDIPGTANKRLYVLDGAAGSLYLPRQVGAPGSTAQPRWLAVA